MLSSAYSSRVTFKMTPEEITKAIETHRHNAEEAVKGCRYKEAVTHYGKAYVLETGYDSLNKIISLYKANHKGLQDDLRILQWYEKKAWTVNRETETFDIDAMKMLAKMYRTGIGIIMKPNMEETIYWYEQAAKQWDGDAMNILGWIYETGESGAEQNYAKALNWYERSAAIGFARSMHDVGIFHRRGWGGLKANDGKAVEWYQKSADAGCGRAMHDLAYMHREGFGTQKDSLEARKWYEKAGDAGYANGYYELARIWEKGEEITADPAIAKTFYQKAADLDHPKAKEKCKEK
jgi:uncharacterized protein